MFWRQDTVQIIVLYNTGVWENYTDTWREGDPEFSCLQLAPSTSPPTPKRGFGKVWCLHANVRTGLGQATAIEQGFDATIQDFASGTLLRTDTGQIYILYTDRTWMRTP